MITLSIDHIHIDTSTEAIVIACGVQRYKVETINNTGYERLLLMPQTGDAIQMTMEHSDAEGNPVNAVIEYAKDPLKLKEGVMCSVVREADAVDIRPTPMLLGSVVNLYRHLDEVGKYEFINAFGDDADLVRKALEDAGEIVYTEGGLHRIDGICEALPDDTGERKEPDGYYVIKSEKRTYRIYLNLPLGDSYSPPNEYPKVGERVIVHAESISECDDMFSGYSESCWVVKNEVHAKMLADAQQVAILEVPVEPTIYCNDNFRRNALLLLDKFYPLRESEKLLREACERVLFD